MAAVELRELQIGLPYSIEELRETSSKDSDEIDTDNMEPNLRKSGGSPGLTSS